MSHSACCHLVHTFWQFQSDIKPLNESQFRVLFPAVVYVFLVFFQRIEAYYWSYTSKRWLQCTPECEPARLLGDPTDIWDKFPCPPPSEPEFFLELDWIGKLGPTNGKTVRQRVAKRCGIILQDLDEPRPGFAESRNFMENCDINCILVVLAVVVCLVILTIPTILCCVKR